MNVLFEGAGRGAGSGSSAARTPSAGRSGSGAARTRQPGALPRRVPGTTTVRRPNTALRPIGRSAVAGMSPQERRSNGVTQRNGRWFRQVPRG